MTNTTAEIRPGRAGYWGFIAICAVIFIATSAVTVKLCSSPVCCATIPMPGGWSLSRFWIPGAGQARLAAAGAFVGMWFVMMVAMMLPSLMPVLLNYRRRGGDAAETLLVAGGYFLAWTIFGVLLYPIGALLAGLAMQNNTISRAAPIASGIVLLLAGLNQFAPWKQRQLGCCRDAPPAEFDPTSAWKFGLRIGRHCILCCLGFMLVLTVLGVMDLMAMLLVTIGITMERVAANAMRIARATGVLMMVGGVLMLARAIGIF